MDNHPAANNGIGSFKGDAFDDNLQFPVPRSICGDVAEVPRVALRVVWAAVFRARGIEMWPGGRSIRRRAITLFMDVEAMLARRQAAYFGDHTDATMRFIKVHCSADIAAGSRVQHRPRVLAAPMSVIGGVIPCFAPGNEERAGNDGRV